MAKTNLEIVSEPIVLDQIKSLDELLDKFSLKIKKEDDELRKYIGQFVILSDGGAFIAEVLCLCGNTHITVYSTQRDAESALKNMPADYLTYFKNASVRQINDNLLAKYKQDTTKIITQTYTNQHKKKHEIS